MIIFLNNYDIVKNIPINNYNIEGSINAYVFINVILRLFSILYGEFVEEHI